MAVKDPHALMHMRDVPDGIGWQADHAEAAGSPRTARVIRALLAVLETDTQVGRAMRDWPGLLLEDAMPLRIHGGLHNLVLTGADERLAAVYRGEVTDQAAIDALVKDLVERFDERLMPWFEGPPQTNEAGRSASIVAGLLWLAQHVGERMELLEIGSSAGVNTMLDRYRFDLGGVQVGPEKSFMRIAPEWRGEAPPDADLDIVSVSGCDIAPIDLSDPDSALRLKSYVWPDAADRIARIDAAIALAQRRAPNVVEEAADSFVSRKLAEPQEAGTARVLFHSIVWQYIPTDARARIVAAMEAAGAVATAERPLAWVMLETNRATFKHELRVRRWPGDGDSGWKQLAEAHPHGAWVEWGRG